MEPALLATFTSVILLGLWFERFGMVAPSLHREGDPIFTIWHPLMGPETVEAEMTHTRARQAA